MENWNEVFIGKIPKDVCSVRVMNGEENGLQIEFVNKNGIITIFFGAVLALRMFDEGIVQKGIYAESEIKKYKEKNF